MNGSSSLRYSSKRIVMDIIVSWPRHIDYPLWRQQIHDNRSLFNKVIVVFTDMKTAKDYREFIKMVMDGDNITFVDSDPWTGEDDWRNKSVNTGLRYSDSEWVWFTEQDFFWKEGFWDLVTKHMDATSVVAMLVQGRMHPACIFAKRLLIEQTRKDFGVTKDISDHFGKFQEDIEHLAISKHFLSEEFYVHMAGLSERMLLMKDSKNVLYYPEEFKRYCEDCLKVSVPLHRDFEKAFKEYVSRI